MIKPIKTELEYNDYLLRIEKLMDIPENDLTDDQGNELEVLAILVSEYERTKYPIVSTVMPVWFYEFLNYLDDAGLEDTESCTDEYLRGYHAGCRDEKIQIAAQLRYRAEHG